MIYAVFIAIYSSVLWSVFANTEMGWLSHIFSLIVVVCSCVAMSKYDLLVKRIIALENKIKEREGTE